MSLQFSTKARTLQYLAEKILSANIAPMYIFSVQDWRSKKDEIMLNLSKVLKAEEYIVRSSCKKEDGVTASGAGAFLSLLNVPSKDVAEAVDRVIESYDQPHPSEEVLIQPMLRNVIRSGVVFSHDPNTCAPYRVINWAEGSDTTAVTGGRGGYVWQQAANSPIDAPEKFKPLLTLVSELLKMFHGVPLDCEFAVTVNEGVEHLWLLQVRPLVMQGEPQTEADQQACLRRIADKVSRGMQPHPFLIGSKTVYGVMPDWNPAEIVGIRPKPLSLSLYRELVTDSIWAYQRHNYGYRNLRSFPLMPHFFGLPYIDVRLSFNSFIPANLDDTLAGRLVDEYIDRLLAEPTLHDKIEFEIVYSCYTLDLPERLESLSSAGFTRAEQQKIAESLRLLTNRILHPKEGLWQVDANKLENLSTRREKLLASNSDPIESIYWLIEDTKRYGTLPFAGLARAGFIAVQMLKSLVSVGVFSNNDYDAFMSGVSTVSGQLTRDRARLDQSTFLARYGHLRPGTYDILSPRYDEAPGLYFDWSNTPPDPEAIKPFSVTLVQMKELAKLLSGHGIETDPISLLEFMQAGIELRELAKFHFTRNLSDALALMGQVGEQYGLSREEMSYCDIAAFKELHIAAVDPKRVLERSIEQGKERYRETLKLSLPPLISKPDNVWAFEWPSTIPNYITQKQVTGLVAKADSKSDLENAIVCIPNADPGYDWLFSHAIAGLITAWGGANSHMAIRAGEMGIPAVIGAGELEYRRWESAKRLRLDCAERKVEVLA